jgi:RNA polymerase sigma-70 factor (ECF subfamily)
MADPSDQHYVELCLDGHPEAYRQLVNRYHGAVLSYLSGRLGHGDLAEEASQETFVRAYFRLSKLRKRDSFFSWLLGIAHRTGKELRRQSRRRQDLAHDLAGDLAARQREDPPDVSGQSTGRTRIDDEALESVVAQLPQAYREVILLRFYSGRSCPQVAQELSIPLGTVTKRLSRAYALLRERLPRPGQDVCSEGKVQS